MIYFKNIEYLWLLLIILPFLFLLKEKVSGFNTIFSKDVLEKIEFKNNYFSKRTKAIFVLLSFVFMVIAFARPVINNGEIKVKSSFVNVVVGIDLSKSMFIEDIYPSRFEFAKMKFYDMLKYFKNTKVSLIGFSSQTFLVSPLTEDFHSLEYLAKNLNVNSLNLKGTDILNTLQTANELFKDEKKKILFLFTDGGDKKNFKDELVYAKEHNIAVYVYNIGTKKGGVIKTTNGVQKDKNGNIVVVKLNEDIKELAIKSGGAYMKQTLKKDDIKLLVDDILNKFKAKTQSVSSIKDTKELFYFPLILALVLFMMSIFSMPKRDKAKGSK